MATIRDIAKVSGVSYPTVSHVLNKTRPVSRKTQAKVFEAVNQLGYIPNAVARGLSRKRMDTVGIVFSAERMFSIIDDNCHGRILENALLALPEYEQSAMLHFALSYPESPERISVYCDGRCDGLVVIGQPTNSEFVAAMKARSFPVVCVTEGTDDSAVPYIDIDQIGMAQTMATHLLELGHRRIALVSGDADHVSVILRDKGCRLAFAEWNIGTENTPVLPGIYSDESGYLRVRSLLQQTKREDWPTALLCYSDYIAHGALLAMSEMGVRCPEDISVIGVDDAYASASTTPPLTTMRMPLKEMGRYAVELLLKLINGEENVPLITKLPAELIIRQSTAAPSR